jgi:general secretion pathway protein G
LKDPWGNPFEYRSPGQFNEDSYDLWSRGPDGVDDNGRSGSDDIKNWTDR